MSDRSFRLEFPPELLEAIAQRTAEIVLERLEADKRCEPESPFVTVEEAAAILRCRPQRIYELRSARRLTPLKEGGRAIVKREELEALIAVEGGLP